MKEFYKEVIVLQVEDKHFSVHQHMARNIKVFSRTIYCFLFLVQEHIQRVDVFYL